MNQKDRPPHSPLIYIFRWIALCMMTVLTVLTPMIAKAQTFNSGSDGSDGALDFTWAIPSSGSVTIVFDPSDPATFDPDNSSRLLDIDNDNIFHFTTVFIPEDVMVSAEL